MNRAVQATLLCGLFLQAYLIQQNLRHGTLSLPSNVVNFVGYYLPLSDLAYQLDSFEFNTRGQVLIRKLDVFDKIDHTPLASIEFMEAKFKRASRFSLPKLDSTEISGGQLHSPRLSDVSIFEHTTFHASRDKGMWSIRNLYAQHRLGSVQGRALIPATDFLSKRDARPSMASAIIAAATAIETQTAYIADAEFGQIQFQIDTDPATPSKLSIETILTAERITGALLDGSQVYAHLSFNLDHKLSPTNLRLEMNTAELLAWGQPIGAQRLQGLFTLEHLSIVEGIPEFSGTLYSQNAYAFESEFDWLSLELKNTSAGAFKLGGVAISKQTVLALEGLANLRDRSAALNISGTVDPMTLLELPAIEPFLSEVPNLRFDSLPFVNGSIPFRFPFKVGETTLRIRGDDLFLEDIHIENYDAHLKAKGSELELTELQLSSEAQYGIASAKFSGASGEYVFHLEGRVDPNPIGVLLPDWWTTIFSPMDFTRQGASYANFVIRGNRRDRQPYFFYGDVLAEAVTYHGLEVERGRLTVRGVPEYVEIRNLSARHKSGGTLAGRMQWVQRPKLGIGPIMTKLNLVSDLSPDLVKPLLQDDVQKWIDAFDLQRAPAIELEILMVNPDYDDLSDQGYVLIDAQARGPLHFYGTPLDDLAFRFFTNSEGAFLRETTFTYAEGQARLELDRRPAAKGAAHLSFGLSLEDAHREKALNLLPELTEGGFAATSEAGDPYPAEPSEEGRLFLKLSAEGPENAPLDFIGEGSFHISDPELGSIGLLGPLSNLLANTPLTFTSLNLNEMRGDFSLQNKKLSFPDIHVTGAVGELNAKGDFMLDTRALDFRVKVTLLGQLVEQANFLRRLGRALNPFPGVLEVDLFGTLDAPTWRFVYDPRNLFSR